MIVILGPTASGKTRLAAQIAQITGGEVISADSRQVYKGMDIGTGKDIEDYIVNGQLIPYHLLDIAEAGQEYSVYRFKNDFFSVYSDIKKRGKLPILCGGSGMYIESVLGNYIMSDVAENKQLRAEMETKSIDELINILSSFRKPHSTTDTLDRQRLQRAIEIETFQQQPQNNNIETFLSNFLIIGIHIERAIIRERITKRLNQRLESGMVEEVKNLLESGISSERLLAYGLEYKYITQYLMGDFSYNEMTRLLNTAIHQFAKRQMTWFRRMERRGYHIQWIDGLLADDEKAEIILKLLKDNVT